jgi:hypothetical protein
MPLSLYSRERPNTHCTGRWVGSRPGLGGCGKSCPYRDSVPGPSKPQRVTIPPTLSRSTLCNIIMSFVLGSVKFVKRLFYYPSVLASSTPLMDNRRCTVYNTHYWKVIKPEFMLSVLYWALTESKNIGNKIVGLYAMYILSHEDMFGVRLTQGRDKWSTFVWTLMVTRVTYMRSIFGFSRRTLLNGVTYLIRFALLM